MKSYRKSVMAFVVIGGVSRKVVALTPCSRRCGLVSGYLDQLVITAVSAASEEYCQWESFNATCGRDQVILITAAVYGRLRVISRDQNAGSSRVLADACVSLRPSTGGCVSAAACRTTTTSAARRTWLVPACRSRY